ncbi:hypothetical protein SAMN05660991_03523 [Trujillonella endophytica]|uniref:Uncharacterized protein n=1 Tax=Trujillonella endophytica TaxID=673521 RepID=A0A1H8VH97_9ACTN|nr:hypothetical protein SAMN05660991_03523 [Trujillella endophytica]
MFERHLRHAARPTGPTHACPEARGRLRTTAQRSLRGTSYSSQMASQTVRVGTPASNASSAVRPPRAEKTWSRVTLWARIEPN